MESKDMDSGSWADWVGAVATSGALVAAVVAARWAKSAAISTNQQALAAQQELVEARNANALPVLVEMFAEHRSSRLAAARAFVFFDLQSRSTPNGLADLPQSERDLVRDLAWFYDNLGALVAHGVVDAEPVIGYLGGSVVTVWEALKTKIIDPERDTRAGANDPRRWQEYFENLVELVRRTPPASIRSRSKLWVIT